MKLYFFVLLLLSILSSEMILDIKDMVSSEIEIEEMAKDNKEGEEKEYNLEDYDLLLAYPFTISRKSKKAYFYRQESIYYFDLEVSDPPPEFVLQNIA